MFDFNLANKQFLEINSLNEELSNLVELIIRRKKFVFSKDEISFSTYELENALIVQQNQDKIQLKENNLFFYKIYLELSDKFSFTAKDDPTSLFDFLKHVREYFISSTVKIGITKFLKGLNSIAIYYQHHLFKTDVLKCSTTWIKEPHSPLYTFSEAFSDFLPYNQFELEDLLRLIRKLYIMLDYDEPNVINSSVINLKKGVRSFVIQNPDKGKKILTLLCQDYDAVNEYISVDVFSGLLEASKEFLSNIEEIVKEEKYQSAIVVALSNQILFSESEIEKILEIIKSISNNTQKFHLQLPRFYVSILNSSMIKKEAVIDSCFAALNQLIIDHNDAIVLSTLNTINHIDNYEQQKTKLLISLIEKKDFNQQLISSLSWIFVDYKDSTAYFEFLTAYTNKFKFTVNEELFEHAIPGLRERNPKEFDRELIKCLIHDHGEIRWMAKRLLSNLCFLNKMRHFSFDILLLRPIEQFKLFTSVLTIVTGPKTSLSLLLPLIEATDDFVKEAFICRLEMLTDDYGSDITDVMNEQWTNKTKEQQSVYDRVTAYLKEASKRRKAKNDIKELNPLYNQATYMDTYIKAYGKITSRNLNEGVERKSAFRQLATTVILAKGGGWKHHQTGSISQLGSIGVSMTLPRSYFISPDNFEWGVNAERHENWKNLLIDGKQYFDS